MKQNKKKRNEKLKKKKLNTAMYFFMTNPHVLWQ